MEMDRLSSLRQKVRELPARPGVYLHRNLTGEIIYVGKARNLRSRVGSYFAGKGWRDSKTAALIAEIDSFEFVTTSNELEAILLENNLIKQHQPRYNVLLRDDKTYPYIRVTLSEPYPRVVFTRSITRRKGDLYFGPFFAGTARRILKLIQDQFRLRSCDLVIREGESTLSRPCLYYDMHQCLGPCVAGLTTREEYGAMVSDVVLFLSGRSRELQEQLKGRMYSAAEGERFELAKYYRDLIRTIERIQAEQQVASSGSDDADVWGIHFENGDVAVQVFILRNGSYVDRRELFWEKAGEVDAPEFLAEVIQRYYQDNLFVPPEIMVPFAPADHELLEQWLCSQRDRKVSIRVPQRGKGVDRIDFAERNARIAHESRFRRSQQDRLRSAARELAGVLAIEHEVRVIESFDISNTQGTDSVAGMVSLVDGKFDKNRYRRFNIRTVEGADDFRSIAEAVERRYRQFASEGEEMPDLILIDGGRGQLNAACAALARLGIQEQAIAGLAKREEEIYLPNLDEPILLDRRNPALQLLQMVRDETHRFAVSSHRRRRSRRTLTSQLDQLVGVGEKRRRLLIEHFGSVSAVRQASSQDLAKVLGKRVGEQIYRQLHGVS